MDVHRGPRPDVARDPRAAVLSVLIVLALIATGIGSTGCRKMRGLMGLQEKLAKRFKEETINVKIANGELLTVTFENSRLATLPALERQAKAREIAEFIRDAYEGYGDLTTIVVTFTHVGRLGPVTVGSMVSTYTFPTADLGPKGQEPVAPQVVTDAGPLPGCRAATRV